jgi:pimeloyl-ACP methyl ester carboxylesterase
MGGMIAQEFAIRHPRLLRHLVLVGTRPPAPSNIVPAAAVISRVLRTPPSGNSIEDFVAGMWTAFCAPGFGQEHPELVAELVGQTLQRVTPRTAVDTQMRAMAAWHGSERLRTLQCPTVVVHGDADRLMPVGNGMRLAQLIPGASYVELPDVGHIVPMEAGHKLAAIIEGLG